jgi:hypothetical protein
MLDMDTESGCDHESANVHLTERRKQMSNKAEYKDYVRLKLSELKDQDFVEELMERLFQDQRKEADAQLEERMRDIVDNLNQAVDNVKRRDCACGVTPLHDRIFVWMTSVDNPSAVADVHLDVAEIVGYYPKSGLPASQVKLRNGFAITVKETTREIATAIQLAYTKFNQNLSGINT